MKKEYVSKRMVARGSKTAFVQAAKKAMKANGYVVIAKDGWIVKESITGEITKLKKITSSGANLKVILD